MVLPNQKAEARRWLTQRVPDDADLQTIVPKSLPMPAVAAIAAMVLQLAISMASELHDELETSSRKQLKAVAP